MAPRMARTRGGSDCATLTQPLKPSRLAEVPEQLSDCFRGRQFARCTPVAEEVEQRGVCLGEGPPGGGPPGVDDRLLADNQAGQA